MMHFNPSFTPGPNLALNTFHHGHRRPGSLDLTRTASTRSAPYQSGTKDDMYVKSPQLSTMAFYDGESSISNGDAKKDREIQAVDRSPPPTMIPMDEYSSRLRPNRYVRPRAESRTGESTDGSIPSMWSNVDGAPMEPVEERPNPPSSGFKGKSIERLRGLTKRYSISFPMFSPRTNRSQSTFNTSTSRSQKSG